MAVVAVAVLRLPISAQTTPSPGAGLPQQILAEIAALRGGTTPAEWLLAHPSEKLQTFAAPEYNNDTQQWCARTVLAHPATATRAWTRSVYFYDPQPPPDDALPAPQKSAAQSLAATCQLGLLWIDIPEADPAVGTKLLQGIQAAVVSQYGSGSSPRIAVGGFGSAGWVGAQQWSVHGAVLTVAYDQFKGQRHRVLVRLAFPNSDAVHDLIKETRQADLDFAAQIQDLVRIVQQAGMPAAPTAEMTALLEKPDYFAGLNRPTDSQVVAALRDWLTAARSQPAAQQVPPLLAADRVLDFVGHNGVSIGDAARAAMKTLGIDYVHDELAGADVYKHGLLKQAKALAPPGPASDQVLLAQMARGFDETGMCSAGAEEFSPVIREGESRLAGARTLPSSTLASLHFMVGDAYATIVWLAETNDDGYHDPKQYAPRAESARIQALEHYRAALQLEHGTPRSHKAWKEAWRLSAGLPPTAPRYFCIYD